MDMILYGFIWYDGAVCVEFPTCKLLGLGHGVGHGLLRSRFGPEMCSSSRLSDMARPDAFRVAIENGH